MNLVIDIQDEEDKSVVTLSGEIDIYTAPTLKKRLFPLTKSNSCLVVVDFTDVVYMDSTGLGIFIGALKNTKEYDSRLKLINLSDRLLRLFKITGLNKVIDVNGPIRGEAN